MWGHGWTVGRGKGSECHGAGCATDTARAMAAPDGSRGGLSLWKGGDACGGNHDPPLEGWDHWLCLIIMDVQPFGRELLILMSAAWPLILSD